ncbi:TPA: hypothetical protein ACKONR_001199 [Clostridioides difficile]|uniref:hypothetical protein n=1 Tax=Clostridioides difficile TaxID=1496 RepID=UPI0005E70DD4|nr:hypothetical protein [Clostridioides difficile]AXU29178.1 hypothetical protein CDIF102859_03515 [Clostridioides difficile]AXU32966.1 hypothetical protein CDIF102860_03530 [Clostridioides difficile]AXU36754.1 hypothetical protein CDIF102978_03530 [Clostridioides difficile]KJF63498.1 hypothetical protein TZ54_08215 [Clostridioides difficile]MCJ0407108.1 hypothetical protein [Clostridioides difficile]
MTDTNNLEVLKTLQATLNILVKQEQEAQERSKGYKEIQTYRRDKAQLITCKEASKIYPIGESKFRQLCHSKNKGFPCIWIDNRVYIIKNKLDDWFIENANGIKL